MLSLHTLEAVWKLSPFPNDFQCETTDIQIWELFVHARAQTSFQCALELSCCDS